jgi:hypothetical protein
MSDIVSLVEIYGDESSVLDILNFGTGRKDYTYHYPEHFGFGIIEKQRQENEMYLQQQEQDYEDIKQAIIDNKYYLFKSINLCFKLNFANDDTLLRFLRSYKSFIPCSQQQFDDFHSKSYIVINIFNLYEIYKWSKNCGYNEIATQYKEMILCIKDCMIGRAIIEVLNNEMGMN